MKRNIVKIFKFLVLFIIGLTPLLWFKEGLLINGADIDFPLRPIQEFFYRAQTWNSVYQGGQNNVLNLTTLVFSGIQAFFYLLTHSLAWTEKLSFTFWFMFSLFSIYFLVNSHILIKERNFLLKLVPCLMYQFNFYQLVCWTEVHIAGITSLAMLPLLFSFFINVLEGHSFFKNLLLFLLFSVFSAGIWVNPPTAIVFIFIFISYFLYFTIDKIKNNGLSECRYVICRLFLLLLLYGLLNAYMFLPYIDTFFFGKGLGDSLKGFNVFKSLEFQCAFSSPLNVLRLMGRADLYATFKGLEYYYPFFIKYGVKKLLITGSYILPFLAFLGVVLNRRDKNTRYFFGLAVLGIILSIGIHYPMEKIYRWLVLHIPLFYLFRQPWLKFGLLTAFAYSLLAGVCCKQIVNYIKLIFTKYKKVGILISNMFVLGILCIYMYFMHSFIFGEMFTPVEKRKVLNPFYIKIPDYIFSAGKWINSQDGEFAISTLPEEKASIYRWGYRGITDILVKLINKKILYEEWGEMGEGTYLAQMYHLFVRALYNELSCHLNKFLNLIGARYIVQRNDINYFFYGDKESPIFIKEKLQKQDGISYDRSFAEWDFYLNNQWANDYIHTANFAIQIDGSNSCLLPISELSNAFPKDSVFLVNQNIMPFNVLKDLVGRVKLKVNPKGEQAVLDRSCGILYYNVENGDQLDRIDKNIFVSCSNVYKLFFKLKPKFTELTLKGGRKMLFSPGDILKWAWKPNEVEYNLNVLENEIIIDAIFNGNGIEDEYIQIKREDIEIDLEEYPLFIMEYMLDDPSVQMIELVFGIDFNGDNKIDSYLRGFKTGDPTKGHKRFQLDVLNETMNRVESQRMYKIVSVEFYCHKWWGVDCSKEGANGAYKFRIKNIGFYNKKKKDVAEVFEYKLKYNKKDIKIRVLNLTDSLKRIRIPLPKIDLLKFPEIKTRYRIRYPSGVEIFEIFLRLSPRDDKGSEKLVFLSRVPIINSRYGEYRANTMWYKDKQKLLENYFLTGIEFKIGGTKLRDDIKDIINIKNLKICRSKFIIRWGEFQQKRILTLGSEAISLKRKRKNEVIPKEIIVSKSLHLNKGYNRLKILLDREDYLQYQWIFLLPRFETIDGKPVVNYEKKNETLYTVNIKKISNPFVLIMKNNYDEKWKAYILKNGKISKEIPAHFISNGFANAWLVNEIDKDMNIVIRYYPQDLFNLGLWISIISLVGIFGVITIRIIS